MTQIGIPQEIVSCPDGCEASEAPPDSSQPGREGDMTSKRRLERREISVRAMLYYGQDLMESVVAEDQFIVFHIDYDGVGVVYLLRQDIL